jgi:hypothetical protein
VLQFESIGDSCEMGLVQRALGAEPLRLFRFAGSPVRHLIRAMEAGFEGMADPEHVRLQPENGEYMVKLTKYDFIYHAHVKIGEADPGQLHRQQVRTLGFLIQKFVADLKSAEKILVFRQNEELAANDLIDLRQAVAAYGNATILWVQPARPGHPAGTVVAVDDTLMMGYVTRLSPRNNAHDIDLRSWIAMLQEAYRLFAGNDSPEPPPRIDLHFGRDGNAAAALGDGWSQGENGYAWSIDERSVVSLDIQPAAQAARLEIDVVPFVSPPVLLGQTLRVLVNGTLVHVFDPVPRGVSICEIPAEAMAGSEALEIVFEHPDAMSPRTASGENDDRRLAVSFHRLSLIFGEDAAIAGA